MYLALSSVDIYKRLREKQKKQEKRKKNKEKNADTSTLAPGVDPGRGRGWWHAGASPGPAALVVVARRHPGRRLASLGDGGVVIGHRPGRRRTETPLSLPSPSLYPQTSGSPCENQL